MPFIVTSPPFVVHGAYSDKGEAKEAIKSLMSASKDPTFETLTIYEVTPATEVYTFKKDELRTLRSIITSNRNHQETGNSDPLASSDILKRAQAAHSMDVSGVRIVVHPPQHS